MSVIPLRTRFADAGTPALDGPPPELWEELEVALEIADGLAREGVELHFSRTPERRLRLQLLEADGSTRRTLDSCEALDLAAGRVAP